MSDTSRPNPGDLIMLPHSGLGVPDTSLTVTALKQIPMADGVAYTATLRRRGHVVGVIENEGMGGQTRFVPTDRRQFGEEHLAAYAAACVSDEGEPPAPWGLLDDLVDEFDTARKIARRARAGRTLLQLMVRVIGHDDKPTGAPFAWEEATADLPRDEAGIARLRAQVTRHRPPGPGEWWRVWDGEHWQDLTARPDDC